MTPSWHRPQKQHSIKKKKKDQGYHYTPRTYVDYVRTAGDILVGLDDKQMMRCNITLRSAGQILLLSTFSCLLIKASDNPVTKITETTKINFHLHSYVCAQSSRADFTETRHRNLCRSVRKLPRVSSDSDECTLIFDMSREVLTRQANPLRKGYRHS